MTDTIPRRTEPARLGGGWYHSTELLDGEEVLKSGDVFHKPSRTNQGGRLYLTNNRLVYLPDRWAAVMGDERIEWPLERIEAFAMTRENGGVLFQVNSLLVFECMYMQRGDDRHLFSTGLSLTDREWIAALEQATGKKAA
ncbi:MAG: hypothetical protein WD904_02080 [Dehalococcoidia bacterium]